MVLLGRAASQSSNEIRDSPHLTTRCRQDGGKDKIQTQVRKGVDRDRVDDRAERRSPNLSVDQKIDEYRTRAH